MEFHIVIGSKKKWVGKDQLQHIFKNNRSVMILFLGVNSPLLVIAEFRGVNSNMFSRTVDLL